MASLADLQTEREALRAAQAKADFEAAEAATLKHDDVLAAGLAARRAVRGALDDLVARMLAAIEGEHDETRVHYRLTDTAHDWLTELGHGVQAAAGQCPDFGERFRAGVVPRGLLTVSQWADKFRKMVTGTNLPGPWNTATTPYLREVMDSLSEHSPVQRVVFIKSVQVGATEVLNNWLGYIMHHLRNKDVLVVVPTKEYRNQKFNPRFARALTETDALRELVTTASRNKKNTEDVLEYGVGAKVVKAGANVSTDLRSDPFPYIACDEIDEFPESIPGSGDPMTLIEGRQTTFSRPKTFLVSTPKEKDTSRVAKEYAASDRRRYHVPCPFCGTFQPLVWGNLKFDASLTEGQEHAPEAERVRRVTAVWYECAHCRAVIEEGHKSAMLAAGRWVAERPAVTAVRGYHINSLYAPVGLGKGWHWLAEKWLACQGNTAELQTFVNERLGEVWETRREGANAMDLVARLEAFPEAMPKRVRSVGIDVQKGRVEMSVWDFGPGEECWAIDHLIVEGDVAGQAVWDELAAEIDAIRPDCGAIDSGYSATEVYAFCQRLRWLLVTKGVEGTDKTFMEDWEARKRRLRKRRKKGHSPLLVGNVAAMALVVQRLNLPRPAPGQAMPGYIHLPKGDPAIDDEFLRQLAAPAYVEVKRNKKTFYEWNEKASHPRNEAFDCWKLALFAVRLSGVSLTAKLPETDKESLPVDTAISSAAVIKGRRARHYIQKV